MFQKPKNLKFLRLLRIYHLKYLRLVTFKKLIETSKSEISRVEDNLKSQDPKNSILSEVVEVYQT